MYPTDTLQSPSAARPLGGIVFGHVVSAPSSANFMLPVPDASVPAVEICPDSSAAGMTRSARLTL